MNVVVHKLFFIFTLFSFLGASAQDSIWHSIPERQITLNDLFPKTNASHDLKLKIASFRMSKQVTLGEYKVFLATVKKDSGEIAYSKLLPDTSIGTPEMRKEYFDSGKYDDYPVVGISWDNALKYCRWLTVKNKNGNLEAVYRLPNLYEYYSAYIFLQQTAVANDMNQLYADWLLDARDESAVIESKDIALSYYYFHQGSDPQVMKRKIVIGESFKNAFEKLEDYTRLIYYADQGYSHVGFRIVEDTQFDSIKQIMDTSTDTYIDAYENPLLKYWKMKPSDQ